MSSYLTSVAAYEYTDTELCAALELLDRQELESLIAAIYSQAGGLN